MMVRQRTGTSVMVSSWKGFRQILNNNAWENIPDYNKEDFKRYDGSYPDDSELKLLEELCTAQQKRFLDSDAYETMTQEEFKKMKDPEDPLTEEEILKKPEPKPEPEPEPEPIVTDSAPEAKPVKRTLKEKITGKGKGPKKKK